MSDLRFDPLDPVTQADPYPFYAGLRREAPVLRVAPYGFHVVSRHEDVVQVLRRPDLFSSAAMNGLAGRAATAVGAPLPAFSAETLIGADPPAHTRLRKIVNRGFTPGRIAAWEPRIRQVAAALVDGFAPRGRGDFMEAVAVPLPIQIISELLGVPPERRADFKRWSNAVVLVATGNPSAEDQRVFGPAMLELFRFLSDEVAARRGAATDDLIGSLVRQHEDGALTPHEVMNFCLTLLVAGNETTTNLLGNALLALARHPDALRRVQADPRLVPGLVEETLRFDAPVQMTWRIATADVELGACKVPQGAVVAPLLGSANRDAARFPEPDVFDPARDASGHLAFGHGTHFCLGAGLARLEARCVLEALLPRLGGLSLVQEDVPRHASLFVRGPIALELEWEPRAAR